MKKYYLLLAAMMLCVMLSAQTQQGYVKTKGRMVDGQLVPGQGLKGATVCIKGKTAVLVNKDDGAFSFPVPEAQFRVDSVRKNGYQLVDMDALSKTYKPSANPIYLVMETPEQQLQDQLAAERKIRRTLTDQLHQREDEIEALKEQQKISDEEYRQALQKLYEETDQNEQLVKDMVERYSTIDYDQLSDFDQRISELILNGELVKADSMLRTKGDINERVEQYRKHKAINAKEKEELTRRQASLKLSETTVQMERDDLANDCYRKFEIFKMQHLNDSAAYYLELRAGLDTTNTKWEKDFGEYIMEYTADYVKAIKVFQHILFIKLSELGENHPDIAKCYFNLGTVYCYQHDENNALDYCLRALKTTPKDSYDELEKIYSTLGVISQNLGNFSDAESYLLNALDISKLIHNKNHPEISNLLNNLGRLYDEKGEYEKALKYLTSALTIHENMSSDNTIEKAACLNNIGNVYCNLGQYQKSIDYFLQALSIKQTILGNNHPSSISSCNNIGTIYQYLGEYSKALEYQTLALSNATRLFGEANPIVATYYNNLGSVYEHLEEPQRAMELYEKALYIRESIYGKNHPETAGSYNNIGLLLSKQGNYDKALEYLEIAVTSLKSVYGDKHPHIAACYNNIGTIYSGLNDYDKAINNYNLALEIIIPFVGENHPNVASCYVSIANAYFKLNNYHLSIEYYDKAYKIRSQVFGEDHPLTQSITNKLSEVQAKLKEQENEQKIEE